MIETAEEPLSSSFTDIADWIEVNTDRLGLTRITEIEVAEALTRIGLPTAQDAIAGAVATMRRRQSKLADAYPFRRVAQKLVHHPTPESGLYRALATLSIVSHDRLDVAELSQLATSFELVCEDVLASTWGNSGRCVHFGWPTRSSRPRPFPLAISWLAQTLSLHEGPGYRPPERQDGGVDLVAWNQLADGTTADVRLGQCSISRDLERKARDVDVRAWQQWVVFPQPPQVVLLVPYQVPRRSPSAARLERSSIMLLDRMLITQQAAAAQLGTESAVELLRELEG